MYSVGNCNRNPKLGPGVLIHTSEILIVFGGCSMKISKETKIDLFTRMVKVRTFEDETNKIFMAGKEMPGFLHLSQGEDAMAAGTCANLEMNDAIYTTHRGHGCIIAKGADLKPMMAELFGRIAGCCKGRAGSMHFADVKTGCMGSNGIVGEGMRLAIGTAFAQKYNKTDNCHRRVLRRRRNRHRLVP